MKKILFFILCALISLPFLVSADWTAPSQTPPSCTEDEGCNPPINVGAGNQIKDGGLVLGGGFGASLTSFFLDKVGIGTSNPTYKLTIAGGSGVMGFDNTGTIFAKNSAGTYEGFLWPRWSNNITYLNYGSGGFSIRNNASVNKLFMNDAGDVGIGNTSPTSKLHVTGAVTIADGTQGAGKVLTSDAEGKASWQPASGGGESLWSANTAGDLSPKNIAANVGIGITDPSAKLHVNGTTKIHGSSVIEFGGNYSPKEINAGKIGYRTFTPTALDIVGAGTVAGSRMVKIWDNLTVPGSIYTTNLCTIGGVCESVENIINGGGGDSQWTPNGTHIYNKNTGNVGIGTSNPAYKLTIGGGSGVMGFDNAAAIYARNSAGTYEAFLWPRWSDNRTYLNYGTGGFSIRNNANTVTMHMTDAGNVAIGDTSSTYKLKVIGNTAISGKLVVVDGTQGAGKVLTSDANGQASWADPVTTGGSNWNVSGNNIYNKNTGYVGIGTAAPDVPFAVSNTGVAITGTIRATAGIADSMTTKRGVAFGHDSASQTGVIFANSYGAASNLAFYNYTGSAWLERMRITSGGNVGIGTAAPSGKLHVNGTFYLTDGSQGSGKVLTSDASGKGTWQDPAPTNVVNIVTSTNNNLNYPGGSVTATCSSGIATGGSCSGSGSSGQTIITSSNAGVTSYTCNFRALDGSASSNISGTAKVYCINQ